MTALLQVCVVLLFVWAITQSWSMLKFQLALLRRVGQSVLVAAEARRRGVNPVPELAYRALPGGTHYVERERKRQERAGWPEWAEQTTLTGAGVLMNQWLTGQRLVHPGSGLSIAAYDEMILSILGDLKALNRMGGICTVEACEANHSRGRAFVVGIATVEMAAVLRRRVNGAGMLWEEGPALGQIRPNVPGVLRNPLGRTRPAPTFLLDPVVRSLNGVPVEERGRWVWFVAADSEWGRRRALWDALVPAQEGGGLVPLNGGAGALALPSPPFTAGSENSELEVRPSF